MDELRNSMSPKIKRGILMEHYERDYRKSLEDSPDETRRDVNRAIMQALRDSRVNPRRILNIGSGPQLLERTLLQSYKSGKDPHLLKDAFFTTLDFAEIHSQRLKGQKHGNISHVRADAENLPFAPGSFGMTVSNMALDMMPRAAFSEASGALADKGIFIFTFHHPDMMRGIAADTNDPKLRDFVNHSLENHMYFETADEVISALAEHGLTVEEVAEKQDSSSYSNSKWWFVRGIKRSSVDKEQFDE